MLKKLEKFSLPEIEEKVLSFWKEHNTFESSLSRRKKGKEYVFFEGPPTANGRPGIHHALARSFKDAVLRYKTMKGFYVPRRGGWDTHGLPVEIGVEKSEGLTSKKDIEAYGVEKFNVKCKHSVWEYKTEWEQFTNRIGYWLDMDHSYVTYENSYIATEWNILKKIFEKKLLYKGHKIVPWCTRCGTPLSSHEIAQGYKETEDTTAYVKFRLIAGQKIGSYVIPENTYVLAWTTTPWTLPGNVALAVGADIDYALVSRDVDGIKEYYVVCKNRLEAVIPDTHIEKIFKGKDLKFLSYKPLFEIEPFLKSDASYKIYSAEFVGVDDGTGVVHIAPMYGEDDYQLGLQAGLPTIHTVDEFGLFESIVPDFAGFPAKTQRTENGILKKLTEKNLLFKTETYKHEYPFCWRCGTPLLYYARSSWFIKMSSLRKKLLEANESIHWVPQSIKKGRFGEWLKDAKDWALSRNRYWGTPLPIWECDSCDAKHVVGSREELSKLMGKGSGNTYYLVRHGQSINNVKKIGSSYPEKAKYPLSVLGKSQVEKTARALKKEGIDFIFASDLLRTKETAEIISKTIKKDIHAFDVRLREWSLGDFNGVPIETTWTYYKSLEERFEKAFPNGETVTDLRTRVYDFLKELEATYQNKKIVIVSHEYPIWIMASVLQGLTTSESIAWKKEIGEDKMIDNAGVRKEKFIQFPRDKTGQGDLHRPFIDEIKIPCACGGTMTRVPEVIDVWFDSGAMPYAQNASPMYDLKRKMKQTFPAEYISEGIDQTRGWFYTLLAIAILLEKKAPYKHVISLGHILDKNGQKMSKSKGNVVNPWEMIEKYGIDAVRWYFYTVNPAGEPKCFDEKDVLKASRQCIMLFYNSFVFFDTYGANISGKKLPKKLGVLDAWILSKYHRLIKQVSASLDAYELTDATRAIEDFIGDFSRWYIRRSRRRLQKQEDKKDYETASLVLFEVISGLTRAIAPFIPFFAEAMYQSLSKGKKDVSSVHLTDFPVAKKEYINEKLEVLMEEVRTASSMGLAKRTELGLKLRQPLASLTLKHTILKGKKELLEILKDEVNVKEVYFDAKQIDDITFDTCITPELKEEGTLREFARMIQTLRQDANYEPKQKAVLYAIVPPELKVVIEKHVKFLCKETTLTKILFEIPEVVDAKIETKFDEWNITLGLKRDKKGK